MQLKFEIGQQIRVAKQFPPGTLPYAKGDVVTVIAAKWSALDDGGNVEYLVSGRGWLPETHLEALNAPNDIDSVRADVNAVVQALNSQARAVNGLLDSQKHVGMALVTAGELFAEIHQRLGRLEAQRFPVTVDAPSESAPFEITGPGRYRTRDGREAKVRGEETESAYVDLGFAWEGLIEGVRGYSRNWLRDGRYEDGGESPEDIVERIGDLPALQPRLFEITGPGRYRTRDGREAMIDSNDEHHTWPWCGTLNGYSADWRNDGGWNGPGEDVDGRDIVERIGDLP